MIKKTVVWVCALAFMAVLSFPAFADQSIGFQQYFNEGVKAFKKHEDQKALRCFKIAEIYDHLDKELNYYLDILYQRGIVLEEHPSQLPPEKSIGYNYYLMAGIEAFHKHKPKRAIYYFNIALIFYPDSKEVDRYLKILGQPLIEIIPSTQPVPLESPEAPRERQELEELDQLQHRLGQQLQELQQQQEEAKLQSLPSEQPQEQREAKSQPSVSVGPVIPQAQPSPSAEPQEKQESRQEQVTQELQEQEQKQEQGKPQPLISVGPVIPQTQSVSTPQPQEQQQQATTAQPSVSVGEVIPQTQRTPSVQPQGQQQPLQSPQQLAAVPKLPVVTPQGAIYVGAPKPKMPVPEISLSQIGSNGETNPKLQIELNSSIILDGKNIQRFLVVTENFIGVKIIDPSKIQIDALKVGTTFIHIWDDYGRHTFYIEVVFPKVSVSNGLSLPTNGIQHSQPFMFTYANDWSTYYEGNNLPALKKQSYEFHQSLAAKGETPYGLFDASGSYIDFNSFSEFDTYTVGLSQIPLVGTSNFNLRGFDSLRYLSPLTMPRAQLRGVFGDVDLLDDNLGVSFSHGQPAEQAFQGLNPIGQQQYYNSYIDATKLTLFPLSNSDQYSFNFATGHGTMRPTDSTPHTYSIEGQHKFNDFLTLNAEEGTDTSHDSSLASLKWQKGSFRSALNFRNIDKDYQTVTGLPTNQGQTGVVWMTDGDFKNFSESTFVETYRDRIDFNPDAPSTYNYDANGHLRTNFTQNLWSDSDFNFVDTQGDLSPQRSYVLNERLTRSFGVWNSLTGNVFAGTGYQNSYSFDSNTSDYEREDGIAGILLPITHHISTFANYEYDWLQQPYSGGNSNPNVINAGLEYQREFTPKISINSQVDYRDELGVKKGDNNSFLSGEQSVIITTGFAYNPTPDMSIFADANATKVLSNIGGSAYDDLEFHVGMRITFGGVTYWDPLGTVSGIVFKDQTGDGKYVPGYQGIPGVKLKIGDKEVTTDKFGRYSVQIRAKWVTVTPVLDTIPGGLIFSTPQSLNTEIIQGRKSHADFGLISQTGIYGIVFVDTTGTGIPNDGDKFIGKVKVILDGKIIQRSDSHGAFYFRKVVPGKHVISVDINTLAIDMVPRVKLKNTIDVEEGTNYMFNVPVQIKKTEGDQS